MYRPLELSVSKANKEGSLVGVEKAVAGIVHNEATHGVSGILRTNDRKKGVGSSGKAVLFVVFILREGFRRDEMNLLKEIKGWVHLQPPVGNA